MCFLFYVINFLLIGLPRFLEEGKNVFFFLVLGVLIVELNFFFVFGGGGGTHKNLIDRLIESMPGLKGNLVFRSRFCVDINA